MKSAGLLLGLFLGFETVTTASLPLFTVHPTNQVVAPNNDATFIVFSANATGYQWRFNGVDIPWGTNVSLVVTNAQTNHSGYYLAVAKNETGWTPSQMAYLSVVWSNGIVPFYSTNTAGGQATYFSDYPHPPGEFPITNGTAQLFAGPQLDQLIPVGSSLPVNDGYFGPETTTRLVPTVPPGSACWARVDITYVAPEPSGGHIVTLPSRLMYFVAGGDSLPVPSLFYQLNFPIYIEWPDGLWVYPPTSRVGIVGETMSLYGGYFSVSGRPLGLPWRKDGRIIPGATNHLDFRTAMLTLTNLTETDCGVYDFLGPGAAGISDKIFLSVQTTGGNGILKSPRMIGANFVCDFEGTVSRQYAILSSTNLLNWTSNLTITLGALTNTAIFSNAPPSDTRRFYRARLLPILPQP